MTHITETMRGIRLHQQTEWVPLERELRPHNPDTLVIGCIDARLNPAKDMGFPDGNALIHRTISALIPPFNNGVDDASETLNYAIGKKKIKHIAILGHTLCGGLAACCSGGDAQLPAVHTHLGPIHPLRDEIVKTGNDESKIHRLENASVHESYRNLLTYPMVQEAMKKEGLTLDGWVIDTATGNIRELDPATGTYSDLKRKPLAPGQKPPSDTIENVRTFTPNVKYANENPAIHEPEMLLLGDLDARINPANDLLIPYGKALIYRELLPPDAAVSKGKRAALEFAIKGKQVHDIVIMEHTDNDCFTGTPEEDRKNNEALIRKRIDKIREEPLIKEFLADEKNKLHGWLVDTHTKRISEMDLLTGQFHPMSTPERSAATTSRRR